MLRRQIFLRVVVLFLMGLTCSAQQTPAARMVTLTTADGTLLKASYFSAGKPGPGVILFHQCNRHRKVWDGLAEQMASSGINVLTLDNRGFGESGGPPMDKLPVEEQKRITADVWPHDFDLALDYLESQPGVMRDKIGAGGASCGVDNAVQLARRHREVKSLVLLSGAIDRSARLFLHSSDRAIFVSAADDDEFGKSVEPMQWWFSESPNPASRFEHYATGGHGADMFAVHKELPDVIAEWFAATLMNHPENVPKTNGVALDTQVLRTLGLIDRPGGAGEAAKTLAQARERDPRAVMFPQSVVNLLGYEHLALGDTKGAVEIFKLNVLGYPNSPNAYDSLSDAYLATGQKDLALQNSKKTLELLPSDKEDSEQFRSGLKAYAQEKVTRLETHSPK